MKREQLRVFHPERATGFRTSVTAKSLFEFSVRHDKIVARIADARGGCGICGGDTLLLCLKNVRRANGNDRCANQCCNESFHDCISRMAERTDCKGWVP